MDPSSSKNLYSGNEEPRASQLSSAPLLSPPVVLDPLAARLAASRVALIGTSAGNPLIDIAGYSTARSVVISDERSAQVFRHMVVDKKGMEFEFAQTDAKELEPGVVTLPLPKMKGKQPHHVDDKLRTLYDAEQLQERLFNLDRSAKSSIEERGSHSLYLCIGTLEWRSKIDDATYRSPLVVVPVELQRATAADPFSLRWTGGEIEGNHALERRLLEEAQFTLPPLLDLGDQVTLGDYFTAVQESIKEFGIEYSIHANDINLLTVNFENQTIYQDLDPTRAPPGRSLLHNPIVQRLLGSSSQERSTESVPQSPNEHSLLSHVSSSATVFSCDSSQSQVLQRVSNGENLIVIGPPGTGKTTTIVNAAVAAVLAGKSILFVTEKRAGAEVFLNWLDAIGLREIALDLHSSTNRNGVLADLRSALHVGRPANEASPVLRPDHAALSNRLNALRAMLGAEVRGSGFSAYEIVAQVVALQELSDPLIKIDAQKMQTWSREDYETALRLASEVQRHHLSFGPPKFNPYWGSSITRVESTLEGEVRGRCGEILRAVDDLITQLSVLYREYQLDEDRPSEILMKQLEALKDAALISEGLGRFCSCINFDSITPSEDTNQIVSLCEEEENLQRLLDQESSTNDSVIDRTALESLDIDRLEEGIRKHFERNSISRWAAPGDFKNVLGAIRKFGPVDTTQADLTRRLGELKIIKGLLTGRRAREEKWRKLFHQDSSEYDPKSPTFWEVVKVWIPLLASFAKSPLDSGDRGERLRIVHRSGEIPNAEGRAKTIRKKFQLVNNQIGELLTILQFSEERKGELLEKLTPHQLQLMVTAWRDSPSKLKELSEYNGKLASFPEKFHFIATSSVGEPSAGLSLVSSLNRCWFGDLARLIPLLDQQAAMFTAEQQEKLIAQFCTLENQLMQANAESVATYHTESSPQSEVGGESAVLYSALRTKGARSTSIRRLFQDAPQALKALKPIVVASPHTAAMMLAREQEPYDLVLVDEISQMSAVKSLVAASRARQLVGFGDPHQLIPTSFFGAGASIVLPVDGHEVECRSLLELMQQARFPSATLDWHYRSKHPGSIQLANEEFYDGRLKIFPSSDVGMSGTGLRFHLVAKGAYRSEVGHNHAEAVAVVAAIVEHIRQSPKESLGVVTCNDSQRDLIDRLLEQERSKNPEIDLFFTSHPQESLFVKNIENVQGDEREVIFMSVGYGPGEGGKFSLNFGPINQQDGPNRINTMMTRYKSRMTIFASFSPDDPALNRSEARGIKVLRSLLYLAQGGRGAHLQQRQSALDPFQQTIRDFLEREGYRVHVNVGPLGSGVDLAVLHPSDLNRYLLGIQTDGAGYQSISNASDRERIKTGALAARGWDIHRAWSLDWYKNPEAARAALLAKLTVLLAKEDRHNLENVKSRAGSVYRVEREQRHPFMLTLPYRKAEFETAEFLNRYKSDSRLEACSHCVPLIQQIVSTEGPIHRDNILRRVCELAGLTRNEKSREIFNVALDMWLPQNDTAQNDTVQNDIVERDGFFIVKGAPILPRDRSLLHDGERKANDVAPQELEVLIRWIVKFSFGLDQGELCTKVNQYLGLKRSSFEEMQTRVEDYLSLAIKEGRIKNDGGVLRSTLLGK